MPVTREGLDLHGLVTVLSAHSVRRSHWCWSKPETGMAITITEGPRRIVGGVDTHKDLHVAAVVDEQDRVIGTRSFATTRQGYRQMLAWMRSFGELQGIGIESAAATAPACSASCSNLALSFLRSRPRTSRIDADAARMTISMLTT